MQHNASQGFLEESGLDSASSQTLSRENVTHVYSQLVETRSYGTEEERCAERALQASMQARDFEVYEDPDQEDADEFVLLDDDGGVVEREGDDEAVMVPLAHEVAAEVADDVARQFRVLTYNVNWGFARDGVGGGRSKRVVDAVRESNADICLLQETHDGWETLFATQVGDVYPYRYFIHCDPAGGLGFLSRWPFLEEPRQVVCSVPGSLFPCAVVSVTHPTTGQTIQVANLHLRPPVAAEFPSAQAQAAAQSTHRGGIKSRLGFFMGTLAAHFSTPAIRQAEVQGVWAVINPNLPFVLGGDFNEDEYGRGLTWLRATGVIRNALRQFQPRVATWRWPTPVLVLKGRFDHILYAKYLIRCMDARVLPGYWQGASDHLPVVSTLQLLPPPHAPNATVVAI